MSVLVISNKPEYDEYARGCRVGHVAGDFVLKSLPTEEAAADHIAGLVVKWGDYARQMHLVFRRWDDLVEYASGGGWSEQEPRYGIERVINAPHWNDYDREDWEEEEKVGQEVAAMYCRVLERVRKLVTAKKEEEKWMEAAKQAKLEEERKARVLAEKKATYERLKAEFEK